MKVACFILYFKASQNNITIYFSICPLSTAITRSIRSLKLSTAARNFFCGILAQALTKDNFKDSTVVCGERQASLFNMDHTLKSIGLRSGDEEGHKFLLQNRGKLSLLQAWVLLEVWEGAPSCWKEKRSFLKCSFISRKAGAKMSSMYTFVLTLAPSFTKIRRDFQVFDTAAQTMTDAGFWRR